MWSYDNGRIKLDITKVRDEFNKVTDGELTLVVPGKGSFVKYSDEEKKLRSVIIDQNGFIVSSCWPKFGNWGEFEEDTNKLINELKNNGTIRFSHKEDGSLCIRSVINGKVIFRTRGTLYGGFSLVEGEKSFNERFVSVAEQKYKILLDPSWMQDRSLLFEYVSPDNLIVKKYDFEDLIFLGYVLHKDLSIGKWEEVVGIANENNFNLVRLHTLPKDPQGLLEEVKEWRDEGVVVRCCDDQVFVKVKSSWYLTNHRLKSNLNYKSILDLLECNNLFWGKDEYKFVEMLEASGFDWELIESSREYFKKYMELYKYAEKVVSDASETYNKFVLDSKDVAWESEGKRRKEFARIAISLGNPYTQMAFNVYSNSELKIKELMKKIIYND